MIHDLDFSHSNHHCSMTSVFLSPKKNLHPRNVAFKYQTPAIFRRSHQDTKPMLSIHASKFLWNLSIQAPAKMAFLWIIEAQEQIEERGFSTSRWTNKSHHGSTGNLKSHILELGWDGEKYVFYDEKSYSLSWYYCKFIYLWQKKGTVSFLEWVRIGAVILDKSFLLSRDWIPFLQVLVFLFWNNMTEKSFTNHFVISPQILTFMDKTNGHADIRSTNREFLNLNIWISLSQNAKTPTSSASSVSSNLSWIDFIWSWKVPLFPSFSAAESKSSP